MNTAIVTGAGPVGRTVATQLATAGTPVRLLTRSGSGPVHPLIERRSVDVSDPRAVEEAFTRASAIFHCIHAAYTAEEWRTKLPAAEQVVLDSAAEADAVVVFPESLYAYGKNLTGPITEDTPRTASTGKLGVRTELIKARLAHRAATVSVMASDFFGPHVRTAHAGERLIPALLKGERVWVVGSTRQPHSFTYVPDYARAMIIAATDEALWGQVVHAPTAPPVTWRELAELITTVGRAPTPKLSVIPAWLLHALGLVNTDARELAETAYQFTKPFVLDSSEGQRRFGFAPTPLADAIAETVAWWQAQ
ncbi:MAG: NAD-dependent epimerase/dehydratase family protein [Propionibacteriales bacterium]|nr:NAD-dependent epimerase/dehydratase family protein [Propionibacteriales bacterium]